MVHVAAAVIRNRSKILITRRKSDEKLGGFWEFPGGKLEKGESVQDCLVREIQEELDLLIQTGRIITESLYSYPDFTVKLTAVAAAILEGRIKLRVHDRYRWVKPEDFPLYKFAPADIPVCSFIRKSNLSDFY